MTCHGRPLLIQGSGRHPQESQMGRKNRTAKGSSSIRLAGGPISRRRGVKFDSTMLGGKKTFRLLPRFAKVT